MRCRFSSIALLPIAMFACSGEDHESPPPPMPIASSELVSIEIDGIRDEEIRSSAYAADKRLEGAAAEPYDAFLLVARNALNGRDPAKIDVESVAIGVGAGSTGIGAGGLGDVMATVEVFLTDGTSAAPI